MSTTIAEKLSLCINGKHVCFVKQMRIANTNALIKAAHKILEKELKNQIVIKEIFCPFEGWLNLVTKDNSFKQRLKQLFRFKTTTLPEQNIFVTIDGYNNQ